MKKIIIILICCVILLQGACAIPAGCGVAEGNFNEISAYVELQDGTTQVIVHYFEKDKGWAEGILNFTSKALPLLEETRGVPYPHGHYVEIFGANKDAYGDFGADAGDCGIWITPSVGFTEERNEVALAHELSHLWDWRNKKVINDLWLAEGFADLNAHLVLLKMNRTYDADWIKAQRFLLYSSMKSVSDYPLDGFTYLGNSQRRIKYGYGKSMVFTYLIYKTYGLETIQQTNQKLLRKNVFVDSAAYKEAMEEVVGGNLDELFSGWVFEGEYYVEFKEADEFSNGHGEAMSKLSAARKFSGNNEKSKRFNASCVNQNVEKAKLEFAAGHYNKSIGYSEAAMEGCGGMLVGASVSWGINNENEDDDESARERELAREREREKYAETDTESDKGIQYSKLIPLIIGVCTIVAVVAVVVVFVFSSEKKYTLLTKSDYYDLLDNAITSDTRESVRDLLLRENVMQCNHCGLYYSERNWKINGRCTSPTCSR